ncbi:hypothetical protein AAC387_Pa01g1660 [Persea americana]
MELTEPRWKGKGFAATALANPISKIVSQLQSSLLQSESCALILGSDVLLEADQEQADLLNRACFGRPIITADKDKQRFQLGLEEAFYLFHHLRCLSILDEDKRSKDDGELWEYMKSKRRTFSNHYVAYSHLRSKNWVVRSGAQYGVDFVVYRHHPALVHSEYAVLVLCEDGDGGNDRLRVWSDLHCMLRLCGSVAKTLLVLNINKKGADDRLPSCLEQYYVEERTLKRWIPEQCREDQMARS